MATANNISEKEKKQLCLSYESKLKHILPERGKWTNLKTS